MRLSNSLWGGRFNPIVIAGREEADSLIDSFHADVILPLGDSETIRGFLKRFPYLITPFFLAESFSGGVTKGNQAQVLDIQNALVYLRGRQEWRALKKKGFRVYVWHPDDPLADVFLAQFGMYPSATEDALGYQGIFAKATNAAEFAIDPALPVPAEVLDHPTIASLSRYSLKRHHTTRGSWDAPGFFVGDASSLDDLVCYWNLRAADVPLWFVDPKHLDRCRAIIPPWQKRIRETVSRQHDPNEHVVVWSQREDVKEVREVFGDVRLMTCSISKYSWNGFNVRPPMMYFDQLSTLGVVGREGGAPKVSFSLANKPISDDLWFHTQLLVASLSFVGALYEDREYTLAPLFIPELNEFYGRTMHFMYDRLRIEPEGIGLIIEATETDAFLNALYVPTLIERVLGVAGFHAEPSPAGLIARQLITQMGGLQGARVFKIPGVRRLLRTHGPTASFTKKSALQLIGEKDPNNTHAVFEDHKDLYIEPREPGTALTPHAVFSYMVEKGLFLIGVELTCPSCRMMSWVPLDTLKQQVVCDLCGQEYDARRQLVNERWYYRRSGVLGIEKNAQGAVPVALTLQQLDTNLHRGMYCPSLEVKPKNDADLPTCELDFVWVVARTYPNRSAIILGECKDQGPIKREEFARDIDNLRRVADALPEERLEAFVLLAKLSPFDPEEIELAKTLNDKYKTRAILLTNRELEPYLMYKRDEEEFGIRRYGTSPEDLAQATKEMYFKA